MEGRPSTADAGALTEIGTRDIYTDEHDEFRRTVRAFFETSVAPFHAQWEEEGVVPRSVWREAGEAGLLGVALGEEDGGPGGNILHASVVWEEQGYSGLTGPGFSLHSDIVIPYLAKYGSEEQKERYLPGMLDGSIVGAIAMTEPGTGSDLQGIRSKAVGVDGSPGAFSLSGSKTFITNGGSADVVIVVARTGENDGRGGGISLFLVEAGMEGFSRGKPLSKIGLKGQDTSELFFDEVRLDRQAHLLGEEGKGFAYLMTELPQERLLIADAGLAAAEGAFEWTREYVGERKAFGQALKEFQTIGHEMAKIKTELVACRAFVDQCLLSHSRGVLSPQVASMVKAHATDLQCSAIDRCLQLWGGYGYMAEYGVARAFVDARVQRIYGGTNEIMMASVSRHV